MKERGRSKAGRFTKRDPTQAAPEALLATIRFSKRGLIDLAPASPRS